MVCLYIYIYIYMYKKNYQENFEDIGHSLDTMDSNLEHMENQNRRNNMKIIGVPDDKNEEKIGIKT